MKSQAILTDELLDYLGEHFVDEGIRERTGITFAQFVAYHSAGMWKWLA